MVREIVHVQVGQCGNYIGNEFWKSIMKEHGLNKKGEVKGIADERLLNNIEVYFNEVDTQKYVPRAALVDMDPSTLDVIKSSVIGPTFKPDNMVFGATSAGNNFCKGHYTEGAELIDECMDVIRMEMEACECTQALQLTHSLGGGCGSGLGTLILTKLRDMYMSKLTSCFTVFPSPKVSDIVVEPYNATLAIHRLLEESDLTFVLDNEALFDITHNTLKKKKPKYKDLNWIISLVMSGTTASFRFGGELNSDLRKTAVNLIPFPRLHFMTCSQAPLFARGTGQYVKLTVQELTEQLWSKTNTLASIDAKQGKYFAQSFIYRSHNHSDNLIHGYIRKYMNENYYKLPMDVIDLFHLYTSVFKGGSGNIATEEVDREMVNLQTKYADDYVAFIPNNLKSCIVDVGSTTTAKSATLIANTTAMGEVFKRISKQFLKMFRRKAFLHWYKGEGMDSMEFEECDKNLRDLVTEFQDKQDVVVDITDIYHRWEDNTDDEDEDYADEEDEDEDDDES